MALRVLELADFCGIDASLYQSVYLLNCERTVFFVGNAKPLCIAVKDLYSGLPAGNKLIYYVRDEELSLEVAA